MGEKKEKICISVLFFALFSLMIPFYGMTPAYAIDSDGDGVDDSVDICIGDDATGDSDGDGTCDDTDPTPTGDDDLDGVDNALDQCIGDDASGDTDGDGICDNLDFTPTGDDDNDGVDNAEDLCNGDDATGDSDGDGICDDIDTTPTGDDDNDGVDNAEDLCNGDDATGDSDGDGICDDIDTTSEGDAKSEHFLSYSVKETKKTPKFESVYVDLSDQFGSGEFKVKKPVKLYNPVDKNEEGISDEITHLVGYKIKTKDSDYYEDREIKVLATNQFGEITLDVKKPKLLLVPSAKDHSSTPEELDPVTTNHFMCYNVKVAEDTPKFQKRTVNVFDPNFDENRDLKVKKPKMLCSPVQKIHDDVTTEIEDSENNLLCYKVKKERGEAKHSKTSVFTNNQFGPEALDTKKEKELCVPSEIELETPLVIEEEEEDDDDEEEDEEDDDEENEDEDD